MNASFSPSVSVVIPCHNVGSALDLQLQALERQVDAPIFEVLLVDNRCNPELEEFARRHPALTVRVVTATRVAGTAYARNMGIAVAAADKLLFCDADDVVIPRWVARGAQALERYEAFTGGALPMDARYFDLSLDEILTHYDAEWHDSGEIEFGTNSYPILLGCSFGMRRETALALGGFDRSLGAQAEDNDLAFRIVRKLGRLPIVRTVGIAYRLRPESERTWSRAIEAGRKHAWVCGRHKAFDRSPAFAGHWILRSIREPAKRIAKGQLNRDAQGRQVGVAVGRIEVALKRVPTPKYGVYDGDGIDASWSRR